MTYKINYKYLIEKNTKNIPKYIPYLPYESETALQAKLAYMEGWETEANILRGISEKLIKLKLNDNVNNPDLVNIVLSIVKKENEELIFLF